MTSRQIGNYRILDYVGGGGFGSVFRAEDLNSPGRIVAIKELHKKHSRSAVIKQRFFQEALAMARLDHPNLPRIYTFGEDNGSYYLVMEFVYGRPLSEEIQHTGPIPEQRAVQIITQVLEAVSYAHKNGVIHRDLKPDNIILTNDNGSPGVKVLDFGIAKMVGGENLTMSGEGFGTPTYMSPERIGGGSDLDRRTDIYSIGIILFEMLAGQVPFATKSTDPLFYWTEMRRLHESEPLPDLSSLGVSPGLQQVFRKAAAKRLEDRYSTADEMLAVLRGKSPTASLILFTAPGQADIYVDNVLRGASDEAGHATIDGLAPGVQNVRVSKAGYGVYNIDVAL
ncbi:MAG TPA: protein kinase, partial [Blastocatellia bacterium]|nr:protein kinase [Blastocatellia bacterium]